MSNAVAAAPIAGFSGDEELVTIDELSRRIKYGKDWIRLKVNGGVLP